MNVEYLTGVRLNSNANGLLAQASMLIGGYAEKGLMLGQSSDALAQMTEKGELVLANDFLNGSGVIGTIGITQEWSGGDMLELGAWAVNQEYRHHGVGIGLLERLAVVLADHPDGLKTVIAFANANSGPIFASLGATVLPQKLMDPAAFGPCESCHCDKSCLKPGQLCVDTIYNLTEVMRSLAEEYNSQPFYHR